MTAVPYRQDDPARGSATVADLVGMWAQRTPDAAALASIEGDELSFADVRDALEQVREQLRRLGIGPADRVAMSLPDGPELALALLTVASAAGCAPLNPGYREQELEFSLRDLDVAAVVVPAGSTGPAAETAARHGVLVVELEPTGRGAFALHAEGRGVGRSPRAADGAALLLHTSGTTARPKLVPLRHDNLCASAANVAASLELQPGDRALTVMPLFHIHGLVASVLAPLAAGSTVVATPGFDGVRFLDWLEVVRPTWYTAVPAMHMAVLDRARVEKERARAAGLRLIRSSSASLPVPVLEELEDVFGCPVVEAYGMTEAAHQMAANPLPPRARKPGSVGLPAGPDVAVLDPKGRSLAAGEVGEVAVRGTNVFSGYADNPEANASAFTGGWFRTGDQGTFDDDGYLFLRGRLKEIINRGGEKISPGEVEDALIAHEAVSDAVAFARPHSQLGEEVAAAVVLEGEASVADLQSFAARRLAAFKVPRTIVTLDRLPRTPTGKVQRVGLAERLGLPELRVEEGGRPDYEAPRTPLEARLCELYGELLDVDRVGVHDDFFALGADSLHVQQLLATIDGERGVEQETLACVMLRAPTPQRLAALLEGRGPAAARLIEVEPRRDGPPFFFFPTHDWAIAGLGALAGRLDTGHPVCTFKLSAHDLSQPDRSVEGVARLLSGDIRSVQPTGPYYLGGHCFGAAVALEVARGLAGTGEEVAALVLVNPIGERPGSARKAWRLISFHARRGSLRAWSGRRLRRWRDGRRSRTGNGTDVLVVDLARASAAYRPDPYEGAATVIAGEGYVGSQEFWKSHIGSLDWRTASATEVLFRPPHVDALAAELNAVLESPSR